MQGEEEVPFKLRIQGRKGHNHKRLNGIYELRRELVGGRVSYEKLLDGHDPMLIWFWSKKSVWMIAKKSMIHTDKAYACVQEALDEDFSDPSKVCNKPWKVYDRNVETHVEDSAMSIVPLDLSDDGDSQEKEVERTMEDLQEEKLILLEEIESLRKQMDIMEDQVKEVDDILHGFDQDKVEAKSLNGYLQESIMKLKVEERQLRRKTTSETAKSKDARALHAEMMQTASAKVISNPSIEELGMLVSEGRCKEDVLLECIFSVFDDLGVEKSVNQVVGNSTTICNKFLKEVGITPVTLAPIVAESPSLSPVQPKIIE